MEMVTRDNNQLPTTISKSALKAQSNMAQRVQMAKRASSFVRMLYQNAAMEALLTANDAAFLMKAANQLDSDSPEEIEQAKATIRHILQMANAQQLDIANFAALQIMDEQQRFNPQAGDWDWHDFLFGE